MSPVTPQFPFHSHSSLLHQSPLQSFAYRNTPQSTLTTPSLEQQPAPPQEEKTIEHVKKEKAVGQELPKKKGKRKPSHAGEVPEGEEKTVKQIESEIPQTSKRKKKKH